MFVLLYPLLFLLFLPFQAPAQRENSTPATPLAPSLPVLNEKEEREIEGVIGRLILYEAGKLKGKEALKAVADFNQLGHEAVPQLIEGLNKAAEDGNSCASVLIAKRLHSLFSASEDQELLDFARENIGAGVSAKRHINILKDLRLACQLRKSALQRQQLAFAKIDPEKKPLKVLTMKELAAAAGSSGPDKLKAILSELERRQGDTVLRVLVASFDSSDKEIQQLAKTLLAKHVTRQSPIFIKSRFRDDRPEVRIAATQAVARKRLLFGDELIDLLGDPNEDVRQAARQTLIQISGGTDLGPERGVSSSEVERSILDWRHWWARQKP